MSVNLLISPSVRTLACAIGVMVAGMPPVHADPPAPNEEPEIVHVELWHGLHRVDDWAPNNKALQAIAPTVKTPAQLAQEPLVKPAERVVTVGWPRPIQDGPPFSRWPEPRLSRPSVPLVSRPAPWLELLRARLVNVPEKPAKTAAVSEPKRVANNEAIKPGANDLSEAQETVAATARSAAPASLPHAGAQTPAPEAMSKAVLQAAIIIAVAIVAPLVTLVSFFWLLGRHSRRFGPLFRIDYAGSASMIAGPFTATVQGQVAHEAALPASVNRSGNLNDLQVGQPLTSAAPSREHAPESFDLGPTFEEQRNLKLAQAQRQEEAVLQQLFEENMRLHEKIEQAQVSPPYEGKSSISPPNEGKSSVSPPYEGGAGGGYVTSPKQQRSI